MRLSGGFNSREDAVEQSQEIHLRLLAFPPEINHSSYQFRSNRHRRYFTVGEARETSR